MILRQGDVPPDPKQRASFESLRVSDAGGLTQFGAYVQTLQPGQRTSNRHWHEREDEFLYMLSGEATVVEDDGVVVFSIVVDEVEAGRSQPVAKAAVRARAAATGMSFMTSP